MSYKIQGIAPQLPGGAVSHFAATANDAFKTLEALKPRCLPNGRVHVYFNNVVVSEEELSQDAQAERSSQW